MGANIVLGGGSPVQEDVEIGVVVPKQHNMPAYSAEQKAEAAKQLQGLQMHHSKAPPALPGLKVPMTTNAAAYVKPSAPIPPQHAPLTPGSHGADSHRGPEGGKSADWRKQAAGDRHKMGNLTGATAAIQAKVNSGMTPPGTQHSLSGHLPPDSLEPSSPSPASPGGTVQPHRQRASPSREGVQPY